jgi:adenylate kinase family enzyme
MELSEFNLHDIKPLSIFILGGEGAGKTTLIKKIIQKDTTVVWTREYDMDPFVHTDLYTFPDAIQNFKRRASIAAQRDINLPLTNVVIDDLIEESDGIMSDGQHVDRIKRWENNVYVRDVLSNSHHWQMRFILASRYALIQRPGLRNLLGYVFIFPDNIRHNKKRLHFTYQYYLNNRDIVSREVYEECMNVLEDHRALVIDYLHGKIFYY